MGDMEKDLCFKLGLKEAMSFIMVIKFIVKDIRKEQRLTLKQLSYKTGISTTHLNDIESNYKMPSLIFAIKLQKH